MLMMMMTMIVGLMLMMMTMIVVLMLLLLMMLMIMLMLMLLLSLLLLLTIEVARLVPATTLPPVRWRLHAPATRPTQSAAQTSPIRPPTSARRALSRRSAACAHSVRAARSATRLQTTQRCEFRTSTWWDRQRSIFKSMIFGFNCTVCVSECEVVVQDPSRAFPSI